MGNIMAYAEETSLTNVDFAYISNDGVNDRKVKVTNFPISVAQQAALDLKAPLSNAALVTPTITQPVINVTSDAAGDLYFRNGAGAFSRLPISVTAGHVLTVVSGLPAWAAPVGGGGGVALADSPDWLGDHQFLKAGAVSLPTINITGAWFTGGTSTTTMPHMLVMPAGTTANTWSTAGTGVGINGASGFTGNLLDCQVNGVAKFTVRASGGPVLNIGSDASGDMYYRTSGGVLARLGIGANGDHLILAAGLPAWVASLTNTAGAGVITKSNGTNLVASLLTDNGTTISGAANLDLTGHMAFGTGTLDTTYWGENTGCNVIVDAEGDLSGSPSAISKTVGGFFGQRVNFNVDGNSSQDIQGVNGTVRFHGSMTNHWPGFANGVFGMAVNDSSGNIGVMRGGTFSAFHQNAGTITNLDAISLTCRNNGITAAGVATNQTLSFGVLRVEGGADSTSALGHHTRIVCDAAGSTITTSTGYNSALDATNSGAITTHYHYRSRTPTVTGSGTIGTLYGFYSESLAGIAGVTTAWQLYFAGSTNQSRIEGLLRVGQLLVDAVVINDQTGTSYTLLATDAGKAVVLNNASAITLTIPIDLGLGFSCMVIQKGAGQVTFTPSSTVLRNRQSHTKTAGQWAMCSLVAHAANDLTLGGDTAA